MLPSLVGAPPPTAPTSRHMLAQQDPTAPAAEPKPSKGLFRARSKKRPANSSESLSPHFQWLLAQRATKFTWFLLGILGVFFLGEALMDLAWTNSQVAAFGPPSIPQYVLDLACFFGFAILAGNMRRHAVMPAALNWGISIATLLAFFAARLAGTSARDPAVLLLRSDYFDIGYALLTGAVTWFFLALVMCVFTASARRPWSTMAWTAIPIAADIALRVVSLPLMKRMLGSLSATTTTDVAKAQTTYEFVLIACQFLAFGALALIVWIVARRTRKRAGA
jgi:hypothetical protein